jgi:Flp pilus assembly protein TadD
MLGLVEWLEGQDEAGIRHLEAAVGANPRDERARLALARVFVHAERDDDAERTLRGALDAIPGSLLARWWLAADYERLNRTADARRQLTSIEDAAPGTSPGVLHAVAGRLLRNAGDSPGAVEPLTRHVEARPNDASAHLDLADVYLDQDLLDDAFRELVATLLIAPETGRAYAAIGRIQLARGRPGDAALALERALALAPGDHESRYALAMALQQAGRTDEAARQLEAFRTGQQRATEERRTKMASDVLREAEKLTDAPSQPAAKGVAR